MSEPRPPSITVQPRSAAWIDDAVVAGGAQVVDIEEASALVWTSPGEPEVLAELLRLHPGIEWIQLPWAGVEPFVAIIAAERERTWSCAKGVYADPVAEHALALLLAGFRHLAPYARADTWTRDAGRNLLGAQVTILGGGGIAEALIGLLAPFRCTITVVRRTPAAMAGVDRVLGPDDLHLALTGADAVVLALPLLDDTRHVLGADELALLGPDTWVINVARGPHIDTGALVDALADGRLGGAGLDVTDPEPLPDGHPLWTLPNVIITPHTGNTKAMARPLLSGRIVENVRRYVADEPLVGLVDPDLGY